MKKENILLLITISVVIIIVVLKLNNPHKKLTTIEVNNNLVKLGDVMHKKSISTSFQLTNTGENALIIEEVLADCHCTVPKWDLSSIKSGETTSLEVIYEAINLGYFQRSIKVSANTLNSPLILTIQGKVVQDTINVSS